MKEIPFGNMIDGFFIYIGICDKQKDERLRDTRGTIVLKMGSHSVLAFGQEKCEVEQRTQV
jgi:hypothetical protein